MKIVLDIPETKAESFFKFIKDLEFVKISKEDNSKNFIKFAGAISENEAEQMQQCVNECRKVNLEEWK